MSGQHIWYAFSRIALAFALVHGSQGWADAPLPLVLPAVVLWPSRIPELTADQAGDWRSRGVDGAAITGTPDEIRATASVLLSQGAGRNFACLAPGNREPSPEYARAVAETAHSMGMAGVAFDLTEYTREPATTASGGDTTPLALESARTSGRLLAETVLAGHPDGAILVAVPAPERASPHLINALLGLCDGLDAGHASQLHLVIPADCEPERVRARMATYRRILDTRLMQDPASNRRFRGSTNLSLGLGLGTPGAHTSSAAIGPAQLAAACLYADAYVCVTPDALPVASESNTSCYGPLDGLVRAGATEAAGARAEVLRGERGAVLAFLSGMPESLALEKRSLPVRVTGLRTWESHSVAPRGGAIAVGPFESPVLLDELPVSAWVVPSGLWLEAGEVPGGPVNSIPVRFGWVNRTELSFTGTLETVSPKRFSLLPRTQVVNLGPGEELVVAGTLQGRAERGSTVDVRLVLTSPGGAPVIRSFPVVVPPELLWETPVGWPCESPPILADLDGDASMEVLAVASGALASLDGSGRTLWQVPLSGLNGAAPAGLQDWTGKPMIAVGTAETLLAFRGDGSLFWETPLTGPARIVRAGNLHPFRGDEIVVATGVGTVTAWQSNGQTLWTASVKGPVVDLELEDVDDDGRDECLILGNGLIALDPDGQELWTALDTAASTRCPLLIADLHGDWKWSVVAGFDDGRVVAIDAATGELKGADNVRTGPVVGLACGELLENPGQEVLVATEERLYCLTSGLTIVWEANLAMSAAPAVVGEGKRARILAPTQLGDLVCLDASGRERWRDGRAGGAIFLPLLAGSLNGGEEKVCIYGSRDGIARAIQLPG